MDLRKVKIAIVGCGTISQLNVPGYLQHEQCEIVALCDPDMERARFRANQWGISPEIYSDYDDILNNSYVNAVEILSPTYLHAQQILDGLSAGKHISCQKPIASTLQETREIANALTSTNLKFRVTENFIFYPPIMKAKELMDEHLIGEPSMVRIRTVRGKKSERDFKSTPEAAIWRNNPSLHAGGLLYDDGWHKYATAIWWLGNIEQVQSIVTQNDNLLDDTPSAAIWKFERANCLGIFDYSSAPEMTIRGKYYPSDEFFEIQGSKGAIYVTRCTGEMLDLPPVMLVRSSDITDIQVPTDWIEGFNGSAKHFIDSILYDEEPMMDIDFSLHTLQVANAMYEASRLGEPVDPRML